jgi:hypothetical protein
MRSFAMAATTFGPAYDPDLDGGRVKNQMDVIRDYMLGTFPRFKTLAEIQGALNYPQASISAQLRHLRKGQFGGYRVEKQRRSKGLWEYRVSRPIKKSLFE